MRLGLVSVAVAVVLAQPAAAAPVVCPKEPGYIAGPLVPTQSAARRLYLSLAPVLDPHHRHPARNVVVEDDGNSWSVAVAIPPTVTHDKAHPGRETVAVTMGGGALELEIAKCDGALKASHSR